MRGDVLRLDRIVRIVFEIPDLLTTEEIESIGYVFATTTAGTVGATLTIEDGREVRGPAPASIPNAEANYAIMQRWARYDDPGDWVEPEIVNGTVRPEQRRAFVVRWESQLATGSNARVVLIDDRGFLYLVRERSDMNHMRRRFLRLGCELDFDALDGLKGARIEGVVRWPK